MNLLLAGLVLPLLAVCVNGQGNFVPSKNVPQVLTPGAAVGLDGERDGFKKVSQNNNVTKWVQTIDGIPVYGSVLTTHSDEEGQIASIQGFVSYTSSLVDTDPKVSYLTALNVLKNEWNHSLSSSSLKFRLEKPQLQILEQDNGWDSLVWRVAYSVDLKNFADRDLDIGPVPSYIIGLVNAHNSAIEKSWNNLQFSHIPAITGNEKTGEKYVDIDVERSSSKSKYCRHRDENRRIEVFDIKNRRQVSSATTSKFVCNKADNPNWDLFNLTGGYSPRNEVYLHATQFVDMWKDLMGNVVEPYQSSGSWLRFYVHYDHRYDNAFFDGDSFKFGDGEDNYYPLTSLDIVCHEIGHSITQWHGGSLENQRQAGAMNEAYSDIIGETCDIYYKNKKDGLMAEELIRPGSRKAPAMRSMCNPPSVGGSIDHMNRYNDWLNVHTTSGIYNKAWCLLKNSSSWDYIKAFQVFTDANLFYWNPTSTMHCGACGVESAAADRGYSIDDVTAAFKVVGVSCNKCRDV